MSKKNENDVNSNINSNVQRSLRIDSNEVKSNSIINLENTIIIPNNMTGQSTTPIVNFVTTTVPRSIPQFLTNKRVNLFLKSKSYLN